MISERNILILAGGFGTRLRPVVPELPKILAPVAGKPFIFWLLRNLERQGVSKIILALHLHKVMVIILRLTIHIMRTQEIQQLQPRVKQIRAMLNRVENIRGNHYD